MLEWKKRAIYQVITDRFALSPGAADTCSVGSCKGSMPNEATACNADGQCGYGNYCGGSFAGLESQLDYIANLNMDAVWVSPVPENTPCGFHGYWQTNQWKISPQFGGKAALRSLIKALHTTKSGNGNMKIVLDVVYNHFGPPLPSSPFSWLTKVGQRSLNYTGLWNATYDAFAVFDKPDFFHGSTAAHCAAGAPNFQNQKQTEKCWTGALPDLNQSQPFVRERLFAWTKWLLEDFEVDSLRLDTCPYIATDFYADLRAQALNRNVNGSTVETFAFCEALVGLTNYSSELQRKYVDTGLQTQFVAAGMEYQANYVGGKGGIGSIENYALYWAMLSAFARVRDGRVLPNAIGQQWPTGADSLLLPVGSMLSLRSVVEKEQAVFGTGEHGYGALTNFLDNQDQPRFTFLACIALSGQGEHSQADWSLFPCNEPSLAKSAAPVLLYMNALASMMLLPGIPSLIYGAEQGMVGGADTNGNYTSGYRTSFRQPMWSVGYNTSQTSLYEFTARLAMLRRQVIGDLGTDEIDITIFVEAEEESGPSTDVLAFQRGEALVLSTNRANSFGGSPAALIATLHTQGYEEGTELCDQLCFRDVTAEYSLEQNAYQVSFDHVAKQCDCATVSKGGKLMVEIGPEPRILLPTKIKESD